MFRGDSETLGDTAVGVIVESSAHEIELAPCAAELGAGKKFCVALPQEVHLKGGINGYHIIILGNDNRIISIGD